VAVVAAAAVVEFAESGTAGEVVVAVAASAVGAGSCALALAQHLMILEERVEAVELYLVEQVSVASIVDFSTVEFSYQYSWRVVVVDILEYLGRCKPRRKTQSGTMTPQDVSPFEAISSAILEEH
jgi:hypothetical protein